MVVMCDTSRNVASEAFRLKLQHNEEISEEYKRIVDVFQVLP